MLNKDDYEILKDSFAASEPLFSKLYKVTQTVLDIDYDESGMYYEEEEICKRHWLKLSSKIVDSLSSALDGYNIELLENDSLEVRELLFNLIKDDIVSKIGVDFSSIDSICITQIS